MDALYLGLSLLFLVVSYGLVATCVRLMGEKK